MLYLTVNGNSLKFIVTVITVKYLLMITTLFTSEENIGYSKIFELQSL